MKDVKLHNDSEHAIVAMAHEVKRLREPSTVLEVTPEAGRQAIGGVERFHRILQNQTRALKLQTDKKLNIATNAEAATTKWLVRHDSWIIYRFMPNKTLKSTASYRVHHKNYSGTLVNLLEIV